MPRPIGIQLRSKPARPRRAFTLAELLVVIGIVLLLVGILIPTVGKVRQAGQSADTRSLISAIDGACQVYFNDHRAWPGPLMMSQLGPGTGSGVNVRPVAEYAGSGELVDVTGTENLVLGLMGGLVLDSGNVVYDPGLLGNGPVKLGNTPGGYNAYFDAASSDLSWRIGPDGRTGAFMDESGAAQDSIIPEFVDRFSNPMPILYLRAQSTGFSSAFHAGVVATADGAPAVSGESRPSFAFREIAGYVLPNGGNYIGIGKDPDFPVAAGSPAPHGLLLDSSLDSADAETLRLSKSKGSANHLYPYDLRAALVSPSAAEARQKDRYIIISAGPDRIFGTSDDVTNFGAY